MKRSKMTSFIPGLGIHNICISIESKFNFGSIDAYIEVILGQERSKTVMIRSKMTSFIPGLGIHNICISIESTFDSDSIDVHFEVI